MKNVSILVVSMVMLMVLTGCIRSVEGSVFTATVLENNETSLLVEPVEGSGELRSADRIIVYVSDADLLDVQNREISIDDIQSGMLVEISYTGGIAESYPAQIHGASKIILLQNGKYAVSATRTCQARLPSHVSHSLNRGQLSKPDSGEIHLYEPRTP